MIESSAMETIAIKKHISHTTRKSSNARTLPRMPPIPSPVMRYSAVIAPRNARPMARRNATIDIQAAWGNLTFTKSAKAPPPNPRITSIAVLGTSSNALKKTTYDGNIVESITIT